MPASKKLTKTSFWRKATLSERKIAGIVAGCLLGVAVFLYMCSAGWVNLSLILNPCGFYARHGLPCPSCGMTRATLAAAGGDIIGAFYIQPAAAMFYIIGVAGALLALLVALFGLYFSFLDEIRARLTVKYVLIVIFIIILGGWAVTLARALAQGGR